MKLSESESFIFILAQAKIIYKRLIQLYFGKQVR